MYASVSFVSTPTITLLMKSIHPTSASASMKARNHS